MRDLAEGLTAWHDAGLRFAVATVVRTWRSAPRPPGAAMAVGEDGTVLGSVTGGCVEAAVYEVATEVLRTGVAQRVAYGVSDDDAFAVGLTCGGTVELLVVPGDAARFGGLPVVLAALAADRPVAVATVAAPAGSTPVGAGLVVTPDTVAGGTGDARLDAALVEQARGMLAHGSTGLVHLGARGQRRMDELEVFVASFAPAPRMIVFGATDFARAMTRMGRFLGYRVTLCDARAVFATPARFPEADEVVVDQPHRYLLATEVTSSTVLCVLTHDPTFDVPLVQAALKTPAGYIGVMGSRASTARRRERLLEAGVPEAELARLCAPVGLDLGARTPEETAVAIAAEIVARTWGGTGQPLTGREHLRIHPG